MSTSHNSEQGLRERRSTSKSKENNDEIEEEQTNEVVVENEEEEEIIKLPDQYSNNKSDDEPTSLTKDNLLSLFIVMFSVFLDFMGVSIVQPILPFYAEVFDASSIQLGALYSSYSAMSLLASLFMGRFSDSFGRKPMILFSLFGTCVGFLCCGLANNYGQLLGFRFLTGLFGATSPVAMAYIADVVPSASRPKYLAATGAVISLAFIMGPGLGSGLAEFGIRVPFFASSGLGAFGFIFAFIFLKESHPTVLKKRALKKKNEQSALKKNNLKSVSMADDAELENVNTPRTDEDEDEDGLDEMDTIKIVKASEEDRTDTDDAISSKIPRQVFVLCIVNMLTSLGFTTYSSMFTLYVIDVYNIDSLSIGYITLGGAVMTVFGNVFFVTVSKYIGMYISTTCGAFMFGTALLLIPIMSNVWATIAMVVFGIGLGYGQIMPAMSSTVASFTNVKNRGTILGFSSVASNTAFIIGPLLCGFLYEFNKGYPFFIGAASAFIAGSIVIMMICKWPQLGMPSKVKDKDEDRVDDPDWKWTPDKFNKKDYMKLGKALGTMLANKNYNWKSHFDMTLRCLDTMFPPMRIDTHEHLSEDVNFILDNAKEVRGQFDSLHFGLQAMKI